ncbi:hypothetical protein ACJ73_10278 [Blastomyces percursus]|uniref:Uncharacterized protein n=1 Tax=Blastomyces percursus TaxID=1658174 RepID=A0A1J9Q0K3_9EURO|nr:hypothetical protein ACJ73_10278 [Blastomyces percursus]
MAEVARQFCAEVSGHTFTTKEVESVEKHYWFKNTWEGFPRPYVPVRISVVNFHSTPGKITFKDCTEKMAKVISGCTAKGKPSRKDFFRGGFVTGDDKIAYSIHCAEKYCL